MRQLGRFLQHIGLILPPLGMVLQLLQDGNGRPILTVGQMLTMLVAGISAFWIGRLLEGYARGGN